MKALQMIRQNIERHQKIFKTSRSNLRLVLSENLYLELCHELGGTVGALDGIEVFVIPFQTDTICFVAVKAVTKRSDPVCV